MTTLIVVGRTSNLGSFSLLRHLQCASNDEPACQQCVTHSASSRFHDASIEYESVEDCCSSFFYKHQDTEGQTSTCVRIHTHKRAPACIRAHSHAPACLHTCAYPSAYPPARWLKRLATQRRAKPRRAMSACRRHPSAGSLSVWRRSPRVVQCIGDRGSAGCIRLAGLELLPLFRAGFIGVCRPAGHTEDSDLDD